MEKEHITPGWTKAIDLYESTKTVSVVEHKYMNGHERNTFVSRECGFRISWPNGWCINWKLGNFYRKQLGFGEGSQLPLLLLPECLIGGFRPAVTVATEEGVTDNIEDYIKRNLRHDKGELVEVIRSIAVDLGSVLHYFHLRPFKGPSHERVFSIHKVALSNDRAYIASATQIAENALVGGGKLNREIELMLNSFSIMNF